MTSPDRTVHCTIVLVGGERIEYVRYARSGKWWREDGGKRIPITLADAVDAASIERPAIIWHEGVPGGRIFDARVRANRKALSE